MLPPGGLRKPVRQGPSHPSSIGCGTEGPRGLGLPIACAPLLKAPRSPLALAELQSLNCEARDSKSSSPDLIFWM